MWERKSPRWWRGGQRAGTNVDAVRVYHNVLLVEVRRAQKIQPLLLLGDASAAVVREHHRRWGGGPVVGGEPEQVPAVARLHIVRLFEVDRVVLLAAFRGPGCGVPRKKASAEEGDERYSSHGLKVCAR